MARPALMLLCLGLALSETTAQVAEVTIVEASLAWGGRRSGHDPFSGEPGQVERVDDWLALRCEQVELRAGESLSRRLPGAEYEIELRRRRRGRARFRLRQTSRAFGGHRRTTRSVTPGDNLVVVTPFWRGGDAGGGRLGKAFCLLRIRDGDEDWGPPLDSVSPEGLLRWAVARFEASYRIDDAITLADLARFVPLSRAVAGEGHLRKLVSTLFEIISSSRHDRLWLAEQAALISGVLRWVPDDDDRWFEAPEGVSISTYAGYRYLAENPRFSASARRLAFGRSLATDDDIDYHDQWIAAIESGRLPLDEPLRGRILRRLREESAGRQPLPLVVACGGTMAALLVALLGLRLLARRSMFV